MMQILLILMHLVMAHASAETLDSKCTHCENIEKQEKILIRDIELYRTRSTEKEKYDSRTVLLKDFGKSVQELNPILKSTSLTNETLRRVILLLAKIDEFDYEHVVLDGVYDRLKPVAVKVNEAAKLLLKEKKISNNEYTSFMESLVYESEDVN